MRGAMALACTAAPRGAREDWYRIKPGDIAGYVWAKLLQPAPAATQ